MFLYKLIIIASLSFSYATYGAITSDYIEIIGKIYKFNKNYVYLKNKRNKTSIVPRKLITNSQLRSKQAIQVHMQFSSYLSMRRKYLDSNEKDLSYISHWKSRLKKRNTSRKKNIRSKN